MDVICLDADAWVTHAFGDDVMVVGACRLRVLGDRRYETCFVNKTWI